MDDESGESMEPIEDATRRTAIEIAKWLINSSAYRRSNNEINDILKTRGRYTAVSTNRNPTTLTLPVTPSP